VNVDPVIGLEIHVELSTQSKAFCSCAVAFGGAPNTRCCPVCCGVPGTLPVLNEKMLEYAVLAGLAFGCEIQSYTRFDRKNYCYPDLPKGYQISQHAHPLCRGGEVAFTLPDGKRETAGICEIHMEEDTAKQSATGIDYNRAGVPLIEIVTGPDFRSAEAVLAFLSHVKSVLEYLEISDCRMQEGSFRVDVNLSIKPSHRETPGTRTEMKNLSSFRAVAAAIEHESQRQIQILESGGQVEQETRRWDETNRCSVPMRTKVDAGDYRYFPEPDIPPIRLTTEYIEGQKAALPEFAPALTARLVADYGIAPTDARIITANKQIATLFESAAKAAKSAQEVARWVTGELMYQLHIQGMTPAELALSPATLAVLADAVTDGIVNRTAAKQVFGYLCSGGTDVMGYIGIHGLGQMSDEAVITAAVEQVLTAHPSVVTAYRDGQTKVFGFFVGEVMQKLDGKGNPAKIRSALQERLGTIH